MGLRHTRGRHMLQMGLFDLKGALMWWFYTELFYVLSTTFVRLSIAIFLRKLVVKTIRKFPQCLISCQSQARSEFGIVER